jgi:hypothetical protein
MERTIQVTNGIPRNFPKELRRKFIEESKGLAHDEREALLLRYVRENDRRISKEGVAAPKRTASYRKRNGVPAWVPANKVRAFIECRAKYYARPRDW